MNNKIRGGLIPLFIFYLLYNYLLINNIIGIKYNPSKGKGFLCYNRNECNMIYTEDGGSRKGTESGAII